MYAGLSFIFPRFHLFDFFCLSGGKSDGEFDHWLRQCPSQSFAPQELPYSSRSLGKGSDGSAWGHMQVPMARESLTRVSNWKEGVAESHGSSGLAVQVFSHNTL